MRQSQFFIKTQKEPPKDEVSINAQLLTRGGFIYKNFAGIYTFFHLGTLVLQKIIKIVREEMDAIGGQEILLNALQDPAIWEKTKRWSDEELDIWFKTKLKNKSELGLASTHEEPLAELMSHYIHSYEDLPIYVYQIQTKFRNELRPRGGLLRTREFIMKDLYSFSSTEEELNEFYETVVRSYTKIFERVGLGDVTYRTFASGGAFSKFSDEFQTVCKAGEDTIYLDERKNIAVNKEIYTDEVLSDLGLNKKDLKELKAVEVGNIFKLGTRFSEPFGLMFEDEQGNKKPVVMGSYGIGPARVMGTIVEVHHDEKGIIWPESVAPFKAHLLNLHADVKKADDIHNRLTESGVDVLYDDRDISSGEKLVEADLIGIPTRIVVSEKTLEKKSVEIKKRGEKSISLLPIDKLHEI